MELSMPERALGPWLFGKLPALGDFVSRGLDHAARTRIDDWLSREMEDARAKAGDQFDSLYDCAPAWNFVDCDEAGQWNGGALCASQDRAGRRFPLIMATPADDAAAAAALSAGCLSAMCQAFASGWDADSLSDAVVAPENANWQPTGPEWVLLTDDGPAMVLPGRFPPGAIAAMVEVAQ